MASRMSHWTPTDWVTFFGGLGALMAAMAAGTVKILVAIKEIHLMINSRLDELIAQTHKVGLAEGRDSMRPVPRDEL